METSQKTLPAFTPQATNLCKGIAICIMVYYHCFGATDESLFTPVLPFLYRILGPYGNVCVPFFVILTGYGFALKYLRHDRPVLRQLRTRTVRLYQSYWPAFLLGFLITPVIGRFWTGLSTTYGEGTPFQLLERILINALGLSHYAYGDGIYTLNQTWWYMSLALILLLFLPCFCAMFERLRFWSLGIVTLAALLLPSFRYLAYFPAAMLGVCLAGSSGFGRVKERAGLGGRWYLSVPLQLLGLFLVLLLWYRLRQQDLYPVLANTLAAWAISQFCFNLLAGIPVLGRLLRYLGRHSGNIFYLHSFILSYANYTGVLVFRLHYDLLIFAAVLLVSLAMSICLEWFKRVSRWNRLMDTLAGT